MVVHAASGFRSDPGYMARAWHEDYRRLRQPSIQYREGWRGYWQRLHIQ